MPIFGRLVTIVLVVLAGGIASGQEPKGWLGVADLLDITKAEAETLGWNAPHGVKVGSVVPGSPADKAGLKAHDIILSIDFIVLNDSKDLLAAILHPWDEVRLQLLSGGRERHLTVRVAEGPSIADYTKAIGLDPKY